VDDEVCGADFDVLAVGDGEVFGVDGLCYKHANPSDSPRHRGRDGARPVSTEGHGNHTNPV
jgi:hypothetical protein